MSAHARRFDPAPALTQARLALLDHGLAVTPKTLAEHLASDARTITRYLEGERLRHHDADRLATRLGLHPLELWPDWCAA